MHGLLLLLLLMLLMLLILLMLLLMLLLLLLLMLLILLVLVLLLLHVHWRTLSHMLLHVHGRTQLRWTHAHAHRALVEHARGAEVRVHAAAASTWVEHDAVGHAGPDEQRLHTCQHVIAGKRSMGVGGGRGGGHG